MTDLPPPKPPLRDRITFADTYQEQRVTPTQHLDYATLTVTLGSPSGSQGATDMAKVSAEVEQKFRAHAERWYLDTLLTSSYYEKILHPAYQKILTLDQDAVPLILRELQTMPNDWFWALRIITEADPVTPDQAGDMQAMTDAWIQWGFDNEYL